MSDMLKITWKNKFVCWLKVSTYLIVFQKSTKVVMSTDVIWSQPENEKRKKTRLVLFKGFSKRLSPSKPA